MSEAGDNRLTAQQRLATLWEEYRYRHDLVWRILQTAAIFVTTLAIVPYGSTKVTKALGHWILLAPVGSVVAVVVCALVLQREVELMTAVRKMFTTIRDADIEITDLPKHGNPGFQQAVPWLLVIGLAVSLGNGLLVHYLWIPYVEDLQQVTVGVEQPSADCLSKDEGGDDHAGTGRASSQKKDDKCHGAQGSKDENESATNERTTGEK